MGIYDAALGRSSSVQSVTECASSPISNDMACQKEKNCILEQKLHPLNYILSLCFRGTKGKMCHGGHNEGGVVFFGANLSGKRWVGKVYQQ